MGAWVAGGAPSLTDVGFVRGARAEDGPAQVTTLEEYCRTWSRNGMIGANVQSRGGRREITYIDENGLRYLLKHKAASDNLYLLKGDYSPAQKRYLEDSLLAGYDRMTKWASEHGKEEIDIANWEADVYAGCMKDVPETIRGLLDAQ
jgi:hypothetical protein